MSVGTDRKHTLLDGFGLLAFAIIVTVSCVAARTRMLCLNRRRQIYAGLDSLRSQYG